MPGSPFRRLMLAAEISVPPPPAYMANAVHFNGSTYATRGAALTGISNGKQGTFSVWVKIGGTDATLMRLFAATNTRFGLNRSTSDRMNSLLRNAALTTIFNRATNANNFVDGGAWRHVIFSYDLAVPTSLIYVNDASSELGSGTLTDDTIDYAGATNTALGATPAGLDPYTGDMADFWFSTTFIDISVEANRRKFISSAGKPVGLGSDGSTPTGTAPVVFFSGATGSWHTNKGSGGGFTLTGTLTDAATSPSGGEASFLAALAQYSNIGVGFYA